MYDTIVSPSDYAPASLSDAHAQWHAINGRYAVCPLDCGAAEGLYEDFEVGAPLVQCGHCQGRHTVEGVRACSRR